MVSPTTLRRELLRLASARRHPACIDAKRISTFYNVPEKLVRRELAKLADDKIIYLAGWDGRQMRPYSAWQNAEEFVDSGVGDGTFRIDLVTRD